MTWISLSAARGRLSKSPWALRALSQAGCFAARGRGSRTDFDLEPGDTPRALMDRFYSDNAPCLDQEACLKVKHVVTLLRGRPKLDPPQAFMDDAMTVMSAKSMPLDIPTLMSLTGATESTARHHIAQWCADNSETSPDIGRYFSVPAGDHEALVLARLPVHLRQAPGTYLAAGSHPDDKPSEFEFARLNSIQNQVLFEAVTLDALRLAASQATSSISDRSIRAFAKFDKQLRANDARDPYVLRTLLQTMLGPEWTGSKAAEGDSPETVVRYLHVFERLGEYIGQVVPAAQRTAFRKHQLTLPAGHEKFFRHVKSAVRKYQRGCAANRQDRIESILDNPLEFLLVGRLRLKEHTGIRDACREKIDELIKTGKPLTEPVRFQYSYSTRLINDRFRSCKQTLHLAVWPWDLVHERLRATPEKTKNQKAMYAMNQVEDLSSRSGYVIAYLGVTPQTPGDPTQEPLIAEVAKSFVLCSSGNLSPAQLQQKLQCLKTWQFADGAALPGGLPWFEKCRRHAALDASTLLTDRHADGTDCPVTLIPHDEFCHGLMFAHSSVFIAADAGCRTGETLLAPSQSAKFKPVTDPASGEVFKEFDSIGKNEKPVHPMMSPDTFKHFTDMIVESARKWHGGKLPPPVAPNASFQLRKITTVARYAFTVDDRMINYSEIASLARILYFGWHALEGHDVRHLFNAMGRRAGIPPDVRQRLLNHADVSTESLYGPATPKEKNRRQMQLNRQTSDSMAKLLRDSAEGLSADMALALRELERAEMNVRYYEDGGWMDEAEKVRREVDEWAEKLARATAEHNGASKVIDAAAI